MTALVLKEWKANTEPLDDGKNYIHIIGRQGGLIAWLLALFRIDPTTSIRVSLDRVEFVSASLSGTEYKIIPIMNVCSTYYGYHKPWKQALLLLVIFIIFASTIGSASESFGIALVIALFGIIVGSLYYFLSRTLTLGFVEHSGLSSGIRFKRSIIEGVDINEEQGHYICQLVQSLIEANQQNI